MAPDPRRPKRQDEVPPGPPADSDELTEGEMEGMSGGITTPTLSGTPQQTVPQTGLPANPQPIGTKPGLPDFDASLRNIIDQWPSR